MPATLHEIVKSYVEHTDLIRCPNKDNSDEVQEADYYNKAVIECYEDRIKDSIIQQEQVRILQGVERARQEKMQAEKKQLLDRRMTEAREAFLMVVGLGLLVGLVGNQLTELLATFKATYDAYIPIVISTVAVTICLAGAVLVVYKIVYMDQMKKIIDDLLTRGLDKE